MEALFYFGRAVECPCCGGRFRAFRLHGQPKQQTVECPRCGSLEKDRLRWLYLRNRVRLLGERPRLLQFGAGREFRAAFASSPNLQYVTADERQPAQVRMEITHLAMADQTFDAVLCLNVLDRIPDDYGALRELRRVLKPGAWAMLQVAVDPDLDQTYENFSIRTPEGRLNHFGGKDRVRRYGEDYKDRLERAGFQVLVDDYLRWLTQTQVHRYGLARGEDIYLCRKV
jgi:SAM-dependent methyltransferase